MVIYLMILIQFIFDDALLNTTIDTRAVTTEADPIYDAENNTIARIGNCPAGQVIMNITTGGVECVASDDGDITSVQGDNVYIYNGVILVMLF